MACAMVRNGSTAISGCKAFCSRRCFQSVLVPCEMSKSAIFTVQPAAAYSRATRRLIVLLPTPPFCETTPIIIVISVFLESLPCTQARLPESEQAHNRVNVQARVGHEMRPAGCLTLGEG